MQRILRNLKKLAYLLITHIVSKKGLIFVMGTIFLCGKMMSGWEWLALAIIALVGSTADIQSTTKVSDWELINKIGWWEYCKKKINQIVEFGPFSLVITTTCLFITGNCVSEIWVTAAGTYIGINIFEAVSGKFQSATQTYSMINQAMDQQRIRKESTNVPKI